MENNLYVSQLLPFDDMRRVCVRTGAGVELIEFGVADNLDDLEASIRRIRRELEAFETAPALTLHGPFLDLNPASWDSLIRRSTERRFGQACEAALALGAEKVVFHTGFYPRANFIQGWPERAADFFGALLNRHRDVRVVMENVLDPAPEPLLEVWRRVDNPRFGLCLDIGHAHCYSPVPVVRWAETLLPALGHVHLHDNMGFDPIGDYPDSHMALGAGTLPVREVLDILRKKPGLTFAVECADIGAVLTSCQVYERLRGG